MMIIMIGKLSFWALVLEGQGLASTRFLFSCFIGVFYVKFHLLVNTC